MITEDYCSYELAKLLKEKGFDEVCWRVYQIDEKELLGTDGIPFVNHEVDEDLIAVPTHQMTMKWLREVKDIDIVIMPLFRFKGGKIYCYEIHSENDDVRNGRYNTYEETTEAAIKYCLENLV